MVRDDKLDEAERDIERKTIRLIALRQPVADDLRRAVAAMKVANNLERCGDLAKNIAKRTLVIIESDPLTPLTRSIERMGKLVLGRLSSVLDAYQPLRPGARARRLEPGRRGRRALQLACSASC